MRAIHVFVTALLIAVPAATSKSCPSPNGDRRRGASCGLPRHATSSVPECLSCARPVKTATNALASGSELSSARTANGVRSGGGKIPSYSPTNGEFVTGRSGAQPAKRPREYAP